ncbi:LLM class flavin-dependent oxidoreductase [Streptomyces sp. NPDC002677]|uniref:LLM class flavin-dependent oxidoreductase n=1 Tax=Streptomyces sp. NPDC002677 TaxID=3154774 RepID=UPI0033223175
MTGPRLYSVTPEAADADGLIADGLRERLTVCAEQSEKAGWSGVLVPHNLHEVDPWLIAAALGAATTRLTPLLAVQPACLPPHTAAALAAGYAALYGRPVHFNLVAGARDDEMRAIGDTLSHDERYDRLRQYGRVLRALLRGERVDESGPYYRYAGYSLVPRPEILAECRIFVAGSSEASLRTAVDVADVVVTHPAPFADWHRDFLVPLRAKGYTREVGIRIGLLGRPTAAEAWQVARERFPESWLGQQETLLKTRSPNVWSRELARRAVSEETAPGAPYWLGAFASGKASAPFLVGSYGEVAEQLADYVRAGAGHVLLNGCSEEEFPHIRAIVERAAYC